MKITAPIAALDELEAVAAAGADEIYCGCAPAEWSARGDGAAINRRLWGNLGSLDELAQAATMAQKAGIHLSLALNQQNYDADGLELVCDLTRAFADIGGSAIIAADPGLISTIGALDLGIGIHVSSIATVRNASAARFYRDLGATRIVLPRHTHIAEIAAIIAAAPELEYEAFVLNDGCLLDEGVCHTIHLPNQLGGPICTDRYEIRYRRSDGGGINEAEQARVLENDGEYQRWAWNRFSCGFTVTPEGQPFGPCGLCAIPGLARAGVMAIKVAGRDFPVARKVTSVGMVRDVLRRSNTGDNNGHEVGDFARDLRGAPGLCEGGYMCAYPEVLDG